MNIGSRRGSRSHLRDFRAANGGAKGSLKWSSVASLQGLTRNPQYLTPKQLDGLKASIERDGFLAPVLVRPIKGGRYEVVSGNHRVMAAKELGHKSVPAIIMTMTDMASRRIAINLNTVHGDPTAELLAPFLAELDDDTLKNIHLDSDLLADVLKFDATLELRLAALLAPECMDLASSISPIVQCVCKTCGRSHIAGGP